MTKAMTIRDERAVGWHRGDASSVHELMDENWQRGGGET